MTVLAFFDEVESCLKGRPAEEREALLALFAPEAIAALCEGTGSHDGTGMLRQTLEGADAGVARRCVRALAHVHLGAGQAGVDRLLDYGLDRNPRLRDHVPHFIGACAAGTRLPEVDAELLEALAHPSPARRRAAMRGACHAWRGLADVRLASSLAAGVRPQDDFSLRLAAQACIASVYESQATPEALERLDALLPERDRQRALDAGQNPVLAHARMARGTPLAGDLSGRILAPMLRLAGASRRNARARVAALEAHLVLRRGFGMSAGDPVWEALGDPMREVRTAALWGAPALFAGEPGGVHEAALVGLAKGASPWVRAAVALCLGEIGGEAARDALAGLCEGPRSLPGRCTALARARLQEGTAESEEALERLRERERAAEHVLAAGLLYAGSRDSAATELLAAASLRRPAKSAVAALRALGMVHRGAGPKAAPQVFGLIGHGGAPGRLAAAAEGLTLASVGRLAWVSTGGLGALGYGSERLLERPMAAAENESSNGSKILARKP